ncbi:amidohydrolase family protein [Kineosporia succinea]
MVDAHHHLWDPSEREYPWMAGEQAQAWRRPFTTSDLREVTDEAGVSHTVLVQTVSSVTETQDFLATAAASDGLIAAVVGWVDLTAPDVTDVIGLLRAGPGGDLLAGVRHQVEDEPDPDWLRRDDVRAGARAVAEAGLTHDLLVRFDQLPAAAALTAELPDASFVLDHAAKPPLGDQKAFAAWAANVARLAASPNVLCKLSGLFTLGGSDDQLRRALDHLLAVFTPERLVFGTDWPVSVIASTYAETVSRTVDLVGGFSETERAGFLSGNAERAYRMSVLSDQQH